MRRSLKYIVFAGTTVLSGSLLYTGTRRNDFGTLYAAADVTAADFLRSGLTQERKAWNKNWDFRDTNRTRTKSSDRSHIPSLSEYTSGTDEQKPGLERSSATRHLVFIRHGQYVKADEDKDKILTQCGRKQAEETGKRLKLLHTNQKIDKLVISTMTRAKETGGIIQKFLPNVPYEYCDFLREGAPCVPEPVSSSWKAEDYDVFQESARIEAAFRKHIHRADPEQKTDSIEVYVCHANVIRYFICRALQFPTEGWLRMSIGNCGITWLTIRPNGHVSLRNMGDVGHLHPDLITRS
ncbi:serine/threonine-protein phosphatase PGAM5, mitochondrial-like [Dendronephthya gigantea]|uniref:serine/threonine-protein phosphatase PGAM5, mitochondrial-like n=1 Tax=Dendronephthya gigantea TaxID=151771 RepID=UPI001069EE2A|nr:serine/threonine-protein phosphatase PGAM5, mitochondrial-like [Dendronephthya gigantea]